MIPFGFFKGLAPLIFVVGTTSYFQTGNAGDIISVTSGIRVYTWNNTGAAQADGAAILSGSDPTDFTAAFATYDSRLTSYTVDTVTVTSGFVCVKRNDNSVICWGRNAEGQLLIGNATNQTSPSTTNLNFGTGLILSKIYSNYYTACPIFTNKRIKCWGRATNSAGAAASGVFLNGGGTGALGDAAGELGDSLPFINH